MSKYLKTLISIFAILIIGLIAFNSVTFVTNKNEYKVVKQFGEIKSISTEPGLNFKLPLIQSVSSIPKNTQLYDIDESDVITSDKKTMLVDAYITWKVSDPKKFIQTLNANISTAQGRLDVLVYNAIKTTISSMTQEEVIKARDDSIEISNQDVALDDIEINDLTTEDLEVDESLIVKEEESKQVNESLSNLIIECLGTNADEYGITIERIDIKKLDLPSENKTAVYNRMITERENIAAAYTAQGNSEAQIIRNTTDKEISIMLSKAEAEAEKIIAEGESEYMAILSEAYNDEGKASFYQFVRALESAKLGFNGDNNTLIISKDSPLAQIFNGNY